MPTRSAATTWPASATPHRSRSPAQCSHDGRPLGRLAPVGVEPGVRRCFVYGHPPRPLRVLIADNNADTTDSLAMLLQITGCEVEVAYEGYAVVPVAGRFVPDVCVLDVRMPGIDGWEIARRLRAGVGGERLLLIAVTGVQGRAAEDRSTDAGFDHHILKPVDPEEIYADLTAFVRRSLLRPAGGPSA